MRPLFLILILAALVVPGAAVKIVNPIGEYDAIPAGEEIVHTFILSLSAGEDPLTLTVSTDPAVRSVDPHVLTLEPDGTVPVQVHVLSDGSPRQVIRVYFTPESVDSGQVGIITRFGGEIHVNQEYPTIPMFTYLIVVVLVVVITVLLGRKRRYKPTKIDGQW